MSGETTTSFGRKRVPRGEKEALVRGVFDSVAPAYDVMNDLMSFGLHRVWKSVLLDRINPQPGQTLLDVAGGTGDIAQGFLARAEERPARGRPPAAAVLLDINYEMLAAGVTRAEEAGEDAIPRICGNAQALPLPDRSVDTYTIGFGIRNVTDRAVALAEAHRVLKVGGLFMCLEFSRPITPGFEALYRLYSDNVIPPMGAAVAGDRDAYDYLVESIKRFPPQDAFAAEVEDAGFRRVSCENLTGGVVALHSGWKY